MHHYQNVYSTNRSLKRDNRSNITEEQHCSAIFDIWTAHDALTTRYTYSLFTNLAGSDVDSRNWAGCILGWVCVTFIFIKCLKWQCKLHKIQLHKIKPTILKNKHRIKEIKFLSNIVVLQSTTMILNPKLTQWYGLVSVDS